MAEPTFSPSLLRGLLPGLLSSILLLTVAARLPANPPLAGNVVLRSGSLTMLRGRQMASRQVQDFASLQLGDVLRCDGSTQADLTTFDSGALVLDGPGNYRIMKDGIYQQVPNGKLRIYAFAEPLGATRRARQLDVLRGSLGTLKPAGEVWVRRAGTRKWFEILRDTEVRYHDHVRTGPEGRVVLRVDGRSFVLLEPGSQARFQKERVLLEQGALVTNWRRHDRRLEIHTAHGEVHARGPIFRVEHGRVDRVDCLEGRVLVIPRGGRRREGGSSGSRLVLDPGSSGVTSQRFAPPSDCRRFARAFREQLKNLPSKRRDRIQALVDGARELAVLRGEALPAGSSTPPGAGLDPAAPPALAAPGPRSPAPGGTRPLVAAAPGQRVAQTPSVGPATSVGAQPLRSTGNRAPASPPSLTLPTNPLQVAGSASQAASSLASRGSGERSRMISLPADHPVRSHDSAGASPSAPDLATSPDGTGTVRSGGWVVSVEKGKPSRSRDESPPPVAFPGSLDLGARRSARTVAAAEAPAPVASAPSPSIPAPPMRLPPRPTRSRDQSAPSRSEPAPVQEAPPAPAPEPPAPATEARSSRSFDLDPLGGTVNRRGRSVDLARAFRL